MKNDQNNDIAQSLRMLDGLIIKAADEIERLRQREFILTDLLRSAKCIAERKGENVAWERFSESIGKEGIGCVTARTYKVLPSDT